MGGGYYNNNNSKRSREVYLFPLHSQSIDDGLVEIGIVAGVLQGACVVARYLRHAGDVDLLDSVQNRGRSRLRELQIDPPVRVRARRHH